MRTPCLHTKKSPADEAGATYSGLFAQLIELRLIKADERAVAQVVVLNVETPLALEYAAMAAQLRAAGINTEVYGGDDKLGKQMKYADRAGVPITILVASREKAAGVVKLKLLRENRELDVPHGEIVARVHELLRATPA